MSYTCVSCRVLFSVPDMQREHYKSDWHRYNLKRKIAELPPVTKEEFELRAASYKSDSEEPSVILTCELCHKRFGSKNSLASHLQSKKHLELQSKIKTSDNLITVSNKTLIKSKNIENMEIIEEDDDDGNDSDWESCDEDESIEDTSIPTTACLFCSCESPNLEDNVKHMTAAHSFFIPDVEYLQDLEGLITYLGHMIGNGYLCLWCYHKGKKFKSSKAVQRHMLDKGHCKMLHEGEALLSYAEFYDYSSSYPDATAENADEEVPLELLESDGYELVLPSGATIGHRSLAIYYKQNLKSETIDSKVKAIHGVVQHYKSLGWTGTTGESAVRKAKDLSYMRRIQNKQALKIGMKQNKFQPHYRPQVMF